MLAGARLCAEHQPQRVAGAGDPEIFHAIGVLRPLRLVATQPRSLRLARVCGKALASMKNQTSLEAVCFDVGGTLIEPRPSVGHVYAEVAARHGVRGADPDALNQRFREAWRGKVDFDYSEDAWFALVRQAFAGRAHELPEEFFPAVYQRFTEPEVWHIFEDVIPTLDTLATHGVRLAVVSNWDARLRPLLANLRLHSFFDTVVISCEAKFAKPSPVIFELASRRLALPLERMLHIGDSATEDVAGARGAGLHARLLQRDAAALAGERVASLREIPGLLGL